MQDLSIIIVNYNVRHFLCKCLDSIYASQDVLKKEVIVVDNASMDGSVDVVHAKYPEVVLIANDQNIGFSKANNIGIQKASGEHILILNPDTILATDTLSMCHSYLTQNKGVAAIGVKMIDGQGVYLPESKRGLPSFWSSFYKIVGLHKFFPKSEKYNQYYLGHIAKDKVAEVEVLTGAFMYVQGSLLKSLGGFDERFFMYGEDIDLSKRILDTGQKIVYLPTTQIIHFKGESTKKASFNYNKRFYSAMSIYAHKHMDSAKHKGLLTLASVMIFLLGVFSFVKQNVQLLWSKIWNGLLTFFAFYFGANLWSQFFFKVENHFDQNFIYNAFGYAMIVILSLWFWGWYDKNAKTKHLFVGMFCALMVILIGYALLPLEYRSSRALIFIGLALSAVLIYISNWLWRKISYDQTLRRKVIVVGQEENAREVFEKLINQLDNYELIGYVTPDFRSDFVKESYLGSLNTLNAIIQNLKVDEVVFCSNNINNSDMMRAMSYPSSTVNYRIASLTDQTIISSKSSTKQGQIIELGSTYNLAKPVYRRIKRIVDILSGLCLAVGFPFVSKEHKLTFKKVLASIVGKASIVSYTDGDVSSILTLPPIEKGLVNTTFLKGRIVEGELITAESQCNLAYAKHYSPLMDLTVLKRFFA